MCFIFPAKPKKPKAKKDKNKDPNKSKTPKASPSDSQEMYEYRLFKVPISSERTPRASMLSGRLGPAETDTNDPYDLDEWENSNLYADPHQHQVHQAYHQYQVREETRAAREKSNAERLESILAAQNDMHTAFDSRLSKLENGVAAVDSTVGGLHAKLDAERTRREEKEARRHRESETQARFEAGQKKGREDERAAQQQARHQEQLFAEAEQHGFQRAKDELQGKQGKQGNKEKEGPRRQQSPHWDSLHHHHHHHGCYYAENCAQCRKVVLEQAAGLTFPGREADTAHLGPTFVPPPTKGVVDPFSVLSTVPCAFGGRYEVCPRVSYYSDLAPLPWRRYRPRHPH